MCPDLEGFHFFLGKGMVSDDTEHTCLVAQALIYSAGDAETFKKKLSWGLRFWLLTLPAGVGFATLTAILKLWMGADRSGVFSAGNGPAMRSAIIGVCHGRDTAKLKELVRISTRLTHIDPKTETGALAVALAASMASTGSKVEPRRFLAEFKNLTQDLEADEFLLLLEQTIVSVEQGLTLETFLNGQGINDGVGGYMYDTLAAVFYIWFRYPDDYESGIKEIVRCGGDTDTTAAIVGGILGTAVGKQGIPEPWLNGLWEWPRTVPWMEELGERLSAVSEFGKPEVPPSLPILAVLLRNFVFLLLVLMHGFRRLLPPY